jgi:hypothetical protein
MWFHLTPRLVDPTFEHITIRYRGGRLLVRAKLKSAGADYGEVRDDRGDVLRRFASQMPDTLEFQVDPGATHFRLELPSRSVVQPLRPLVFE